MAKNEQAFPLDPIQMPVMLEILRRGPITRAELARSTGLSQASIARLTMPLVKQQLVNEQTPLSQPRGRPTVPIDANATYASVIGINLTGTQAHVTHTDLRASIIADTISELPGNEPAAIATHLRDLISSLSTPDRRPRAIGLTLGGNVPDGKNVIFAPFLAWEDVPFARILTEATGLPVTLGNDVEGVTIAENWFGAGRETESFMVVTMGAGIGLGVVFQNRLLEDYSTGFGLMGDNIFTDPLTHETCRGNSYLTDKAVETIYRQRTGKPAAIEQIEALSAANDPVASDIARQIALRLGQFIGTAANFVSVSQAVVLGERTGFIATYQQEIERGIANVRHPRARPVDWLIRGEDHTYWARGAAVLAVRSLLGAHRDL